MNTSGKIAEEGYTALLKVRVKGIFLSKCNYTILPASLIFFIWGQILWPLIKAIYYRGQWEIC